jgi:hypothetical protein
LGPSIAYRRKRTQEESVLRSLQAFGSVAAISIAFYIGWMLLAR